MRIKGRRLFNYRPLAVFAVFTVLGIVLGEAVYSRHIAWIIAMCLSAFIAFIALISVKKIRRFAYVPLSILIGMISITSSNSVFDKNTIGYYSGEFTAVVSSEIVAGEDSATFKVSQIRIGGRSYKYDAFVYVPHALYPDFGAGDVVILKGSLTVQKHKRFDMEYASNRAKGIGYFCVAESATRLKEGKLKFPDSFRLKVKKLLFQNLDEYTASVCQALILGDKTGFNSGAYADISASGLAHVLAVSGLHVTTIAALLYFILKKLKINPKIAFVIVTAITFIYSMLCSFTASSLCAVIMSAVLMFSSAFKYKADGLSSLSLAATLILVFRPTALMEMGFLLSFYSVLGIFMFYASFERIGMRAVERLSPKRHIGTRFAKVCALSLATNIATLPLSAYSFGKVSAMFILSNFLVLPYLIVFFLISILFAALSLIFGFGGIVAILKYLLYPFKMYSAFIGFLPFATVAVPSGKALIVCHTFLMTAMSKFVFIKRNSKLKILAAGSAASVCACVVCALFGI